MADELLVLDKVYKEYTRGWLRKQVTFSIKADFTFSKPSIVCLMGPNGAGKTTLFEIMTGSNYPTSGKVFCCGHDIHNVKYKERDRLAIHYHQSYQVRKMKWTKPSLLMESVDFDYPEVHLFDEPQFSSQDGYIGFMVRFFRELRAQGKLVFICLHPMETYHLEIVEDICEEFMLVHGGSVHHFPTWAEFTSDQRTVDYLGETLVKYRRQSESRTAEG